MTRLHRYGWELALAALLVIEILGFGALNPRLLDLKKRRYSGGRSAKRHPDQLRFPHAENPGGRLPA